MSQPRNPFDGHEHRRPEVDAVEAVRLLRLHFGREGALRELGMDARPARNERPSMARAVPPGEPVIADPVPIRSADAQGSAPMHGTRDTNAGPIAGFLLILAVLFTVAACGAVGAAGATPPVPASPAPTVPATPVPTPEPAEQPSGAPSETPAGEGIDLDIADDHDVIVVIDDQGGVLAGAGSGRAGDGMSVRWG